MGNHPYYVLDGTTVVPATRDQWSEMMERGFRQMARTVINDRIVSTVFLGLDHQFGDGPPLVFETMVFGMNANGDIDPRDEHGQWRYPTWDDAIIGHDAVVTALREGTELP